MYYEFSLNFLSQIVFFQFEKSLKYDKTYNSVHWFCNKILKYEKLNICLKLIVS
jgi:hypothetical protein